MTQDTTLQELATQCLDEAGGDRYRAAEQLYQRLDDKQKAELLERYLDKAIWDLLRSLGKRSQPRRSVDNPAPVAASSSGGSNNASKGPAAPVLVVGLMRLARANLDNLLDAFRLSTGALLGDASRVELLEEATREHSQAGAHIERSMFLRAVAARVGSAARARVELRRLAISTISEVAA
jgi:hypothetical protein